MSTPDDMSTPNSQEETISELMHNAYQAACHLLYETTNPHGHFFDVRSDFESLGTPAERNDITSWADGLMHAYYQKRVSGRCSVNEMLAFDAESWEKFCQAQLGRMQSLYSTVKPIRKLTVQEMRDRGYTY